MDIGIFSELIPNHNPILLVISIAICIALGLICYYKKVLSLKGSLAALLMGLIISIFADVFWLLTLIGFLAINYWATRLKYSQKKREGLAQGMKGERGVPNVLANGLIPTLIALFSGPMHNEVDGMAAFLYICAIAIASSDTFASEIGVLAPKPRCILPPFKVVKVGTDGGVSSLGELASIAGAVIASLLGFILISDLLPLSYRSMPASILTLLVPMAIGFFGCQVDSLLGATLQQRWKLLDNNGVNFVSIYVGILTAWLIVWFMPWLP